MLDFHIKEMKSYCVFVKQTVWMIHKWLLLPTIKITHSSKICQYTPHVHGYKEINQLHVAFLESQFSVVVKVLS